MESREQVTFFAPPERAPSEVLKRQVRLFAENSVLTQLYDAVTEIVLILNPQRQIVFCNRHFMDFLGITDREAIYGLRPGEALGCVHAAQTPGGCGTTEFCVTCGAVNALLHASQGVVDTQECSILRQADADALDLLVRSSPLMADGMRFTIVALVDISHEKRRRALERIFFHDLMNTAIGLQILSRAAAKAADERAAEMGSNIVRGLDMLVDEIEGQRDLLSAETHELRVHPGPVVSTELLDELRAGYAHFARERDCTLVLDRASERVSLVSDRKILLRILRNMLKNAIEASCHDETVTMGCRQADGHVQFWIHNCAFIPRAQQLQIFQRSFSTHGTGRGLGTYSMKLLTERYLRGSASFTSSESAGTKFVVTLPLAL